MNQVLVVVGALLLGCAMRTLLPYVIKGLECLRDNKPWPKFDYSYLGSLGLAIVVYVVSFATSSDAWQYVLSLSFQEAVLFAYLGQEASRLGIKLLQAVGGIVRKS